MPKIVLAYSGGLDTSIMIPWLKENYENTSITAVIVDVGQKEDLESIRQKALLSGAQKAIVVDAKVEFAQNYLAPMIKSGAQYENQYILGTISRPLIAAKLIEIAKKEQASHIAHGATGKGNDQVRFECAFQALAPNLKIIAPWRTWSIKSRQHAIKYAKLNKIPISATPKSPYSRDYNMWYISHEGGALEDIQGPMPSDLLVLATPLNKTPNSAEEISIKFDKGIPTALNGKNLCLSLMIPKLNQIAGKHGVGISDIVESRLVGMKIRSVYESPAATVIYKASHILESICLDKETLALKQSMQQKYAALIYNGKWFSQAREALDALFATTQKNMTGTVTLTLYKGHVFFNGVSSPYSLYKRDFATFEEDDVYNQADATGFINLYTLPAKIYGTVHHQGVNHE